MIAVALYKGLGCGVVEIGKLEGKNAEYRFA